MSIALREPKLDGAQVLTEGLRTWKGTHLMMDKSMQQLRGRVGHFRTTIPIWAELAAPVDELMTHGDGNNEWVAVTNAEIWGGVPAFHVSH